MSSIPSSTLQLTQFPWVLVGEVTRASCSFVLLHRLIHSKPTPTPFSIMPVGGYMVRNRDNGARPPNIPLIVPQFYVKLCVQTLQMFIVVFVFVVI